MHPKLHAHEGWPPQTLPAQVLHGQHNPRVLDWALEAVTNRLNIEHILHNAERGILQTLILHYDNLVESSTHQLQTIEDLHKTPPQRKRRRTPLRRFRCDHRSRDRDREYSCRLHPTRDSGWRPVALTLPGLMSPQPLARSGPSPLAWSGPTPLAWSGPSPLARSGPSPLARSGLSPLTA